MNFNLLDLFPMVSLGSFLPALLWPLYGALLLVALIGTAIGCLVAGC